MHEVRYQSVIAKLARVFEIGQQWIAGEAVVINNHPERKRHGRLKIDFGACNVVFQHHATADGILETGENIFFFELQALDWLEADRARSFCGKTERWYSTGSRKIVNFIALQIGSTQADNTELVSRKSAIARLFAKADSLIKLIRFRPANAE